MLAHRAVERPAVSTTPSISIALITIADTITPRSIGRHRISIASLTGKIL